MISIVDYINLDRIWRDIINTIPIIDNMNEFLIIKFLVQNQEKIPIINRYPYIYGWEFPIDPKYSNLEKVDLILTDGKKSFLVIKAKYIDYTPENTTKQRNKLRKETINLAVKFADKFKRIHPGYSVEPLSITNDDFEIDYKDLYQDYKTFALEEWGKFSKTYKDYK